MEHRNAWLSYDAVQKQELEQICNSYRTFMAQAKTERECVTELVRMAREQGYHSLEETLQSGQKILPGDKLYAVNMKKTVVFFHIGKTPLEKGMNILGAHIDSPRLDLKQNPLYETDGFAYMDTHYYGGIKKYQWVTIPLALHGVAALKDGRTLNIVIGEKDDDPVFYISDILIHLASKQMEKHANEFIPGESLDLIVGGSPDPEEDSEKDVVKKHVLKLLKEQYGIEEADFLSAELEAVPAGKPREVGFDRSMIAAYGQDDRICGYTSALALFEQTDIPERTSCALLVDKEEIGSVGATGMRSFFFENVVSEILEAMGYLSPNAVRRALKNSFMLSSDVSAGYDPAFKELFDTKNAAFLGKGMVLNKYTGSRGKVNSNDANAEYIAKLRRIFDDNHICFQTAELGRVDAGGGGTIAYICALYGMEVIDSGVALLSMHAPMELSNKADIYEAYKAYKAFLANA